MRTTPFSKMPLSPPYRVLPQPETRRFPSQLLENALILACKTLTLDRQKLGCAANAGPDGRRWIS